MTRKMKMSSALVLLVVLVASSSVWAAGFSISHSVAGSGGGEISSAGFKLNATIGQSVAGYAENANFKLWSGYWVPDTTVPPQTIDHIKDAKVLLNGTYVSISGKISTSSATDFTGFLYIEESDRSSGIRVETASLPSGLQRGKKVIVVGYMGITTGGERRIENADVQVLPDPAVILPPLGMTNRMMAGGDRGSPTSTGQGQYGASDGTGLNNVGLLVKTWGRVTGTTGSGYFELTDGSGVTLRVSTAGLSGTFSGYVGVTGISSLDTGRVRLVLPRDDSDVVPY